MSEENSKSSWWGTTRHILWILLLILWRGTHGLLLAQVVMFMIRANDMATSGYVLCGCLIGYILLNFTLGTIFESRSRHREIVTEASTTLLRDILAESALDQIKFRTEMEERLAVEKERVRFLQDRLNARRNPFRAHDL